MRRIALSALALLAVVPVGAHAAPTPNGCSVVSIWTITSGHCRYTATGAGTYSVLTVNNWRIEVSKDGGLTWKTLAASQEAVEIDPTTFSVWEPSQGTFPSVAGDLVNIEIGHEHLCSHRSE